MKKSIYLFSILFLIACNNNPKEAAQVTVSKDTTADVTMQSAGPDIDGCYVSFYKRDSSTLSIKVNNGEVTGSLEYKIFEKDKNSGVISGTYKDSLIVADYTFQSEGVSSTREVVFKVANGELIEGFGEIEMNGNVAKFKDISQLKYPDQSRFVKKDCP